MKKSVTKKLKKIRKNVHFFRPKTLIKPRDPKYPLRSVQRLAKMDKYTVCGRPTDRAERELSGAPRGGPPRGGPPRGGPRGVGPRGVGPRGGGPPGGWELIRKQ